MIKILEFVAISVAAVISTVTVVMLGGALLLKAACWIGSL